MESFFNERVIYSLIQPILSNGWFIQKWGNCLSLWMGHWIIDSLDSFKHVDSFSNETPLCSETHNSSAVALIETIFVSEIYQKQSIFCLKYKSLNCSLLFEIPLYIISVTLQSCWYCFLGKHHGRLWCSNHILQISFFFYRIMHLYISESYLVCAVSLTHSLRLCKPHLARHKYIISRRLHWMPF